MKNKFGLALFVKANQLNCLLFFLNKEELYSYWQIAFHIAICFLSIKRAKNILNLKGAEYYLVFALEILQIEDFYFLIRYNKYKVYFNQNDSEEWFYRQICLLDSQHLYFLLMLTQQFNINEKMDCFQAFISILSFVYLDCFLQLKAVFTKIKAQECIELISPRYVIYPTIQAFIFYAFYLNTLQYSKIISFFIFLFLLIITLIQIVQVQNKYQLRFNNLFNIIYPFFKLYSYVSVDLLEVFSRKSVNNRIHLILQLNQFKQYVFLIASVLMLTFFKIEHSSDSEQKDIIYTILNTIQIILTLANLKKQFTQKSIIYISSLQQLKLYKMNYNNNKLQDTKIIVLNSQLPDLIIFKCLFRKFQGCQIISTNNKFRRKNLDQFQFQKVQIILDLDLKTQNKLTQIIQKRNEYKQQYQNFDQQYKNLDQQRQNLLQQELTKMQKMILEEQILKQMLDIRKQIDLQQKELIQKTQRQLNGIVFSDYEQVIQAANKKVLKQIISVKFSILDFLTFLNLSSILTNQNLMVKITEKKIVNAKFERFLVLTHLNEQFCKLYYNVIMIQNIVFNQNLIQHLQLNPKLVFSDLFYD
ncbi:transmembrane protein, putative (macronuclear) [Tetrahymena thermophila SB210]|uniref:Transmembrane protein, putative n=1 Tax=Tetrahymena thermophila (strain SB210) TaxID=312017 RepID=W7X4U8_TETTS|nr:transmembrane protein, putative [Tetrahymena thermophila SB210]EWS74350.1 transmembrane protein, putative [Tetrahymena thermophila SB210]|eukprot:XP_012653110.1 transmembrane protein, putative [Tetrahymena thermophila SB210]